MRVEFSEIGSASVSERTAPAQRLAPPLRFDMPSGVLGVLVGLSTGYLAVMALAFVGGAHGLGAIFSVFAVVLGGFYGLPFVMARTSGGLGPDAFERRGAWGMDTASGYLSSRAALAQLLTVPVLMLGWAVFVFSIV